MIEDQRPSRPDTSVALAKSPPQPIELKVIETEFYLELGDAIAIDAPTSHPGDSIDNHRRPHAALTETASGVSPGPIELSPARRIAAPLFIASCAALVLLTHGAGAKRLLTMLPQAVIPKAETGQPPLFTGAWRQILKHRAPAADQAGHNDISSQARLDVRTALHNGLVAASFDEAPTISENPAPKADVLDPYYVPMALDIICSLPEIAAVKPEPAPPPSQTTIALTELFPREPWSITSADAGPVGRARSAEIAIEAGIVTAAYNPPRPNDVGMQPEVAVATPAPAPPAATRVRAAPQPVTKPAAPAEAAPSYDPFRGG